jgi:seryl-tRNA synthetase
MKKKIMAETAQLEDFEDQLYKVVGTGAELKDDPDAGDDYFLIATSEQPISA